MTKRSTANSKRRFSSGPRATSRKPSNTEALSVSNYLEALLNNLQYMRGPKLDQAMQILELNNRVIYLPGVRE